MTYQTSNITTPAQKSTCANCSQFNDYLEPTGKGWCNLFDQPARRHHPQTLDCQLNLPTEEEDLPHAEFEPGQIVKIIDEGEEDCNEWASFVVIGASFNQNRFRSIQTYLSEPDWNYLIASVDHTQHQFWVAETEICHVDQSPLIETADVF